MIELEKVSYTYPHTVQPALHQLSLSVKKGRCVLVTGPPGRKNHPVPRSSGYTAP